MDAKILRDQLATLHAELSSIRRLDPQAQQLLAELKTDITRLIAEPATAQPAARDASFNDRLEAIAVQFEVAHPSLAASIRRVVDLLGKVGL